MLCALEVPSFGEDGSDFSSCFCSSLDSGRSFFLIFGEDGSDFSSSFCSFFILFGEDGSDFGSCLGSSLIFGS
jgi:hypothetical protein